jgi:DNA integrity scanning protein DisA with diadenylate cyclase activity
VLAPMVRMDSDYRTRTTGLYVLRSAADIVVVAYIIYRVMLRIRGPRAQQVRVGLGLIVLSFFASKLFVLKTLSWILDNFISSFVLIIIVVFECTTSAVAYRAWANAPIFEALAYGQGVFWVDELTRGAKSLAKDRIGAIMLIEREADLTELAKTGIRVNARTSTGKRPSSCNRSSAPLPNSTDRSCCPHSQWRRKEGFFGPNGLPLLTFETIACICIL